jgi:hypothetical protein
MNPVFFVLGLVDVLAGISIVYPNLLGSFLFYMAFYSLAKGIISIIISLGAGYYADWMGVVDIATGTVLALTVFGISFNFFFYIGIFAIIKGIYCTAMPLIYK